MFGRMVLAVAGNPAVRTTVTASPLSRPVVSRFIAGEDVESVLASIKALHDDGLRVTLDHLGEDITDPAQAQVTVGAYRVLINRLADAGLADGNEISVKLSALGQSLGAEGPGRATEAVWDLAAHAYRHGVDVTLDMEDHTTVDDTLETLRTLRADFPRVGCVLQAMLHRTEGDVRELAVDGSRIRLVKGAYAEPASVAYQVKADVDRAYVRNLRILAESPAYPMVATHDPRIIRIAEQVLTPAGSESEFQMLYGIRTGEQLRLADAGHTVRVYVPYGTDWYGYFSRRLAERPANMGFFLRSLVSAS
ncbi:proline dehydrogenase family protein [Winogradskya humida]|uniref:proline dehydrogenase n=1 Tax=Winogradskya humida TaxID=113566 RepID=A0ABQ3ZEX8_9ACTN|nr:proline dehydrogenase family protein [Actinoplanes humidus]GIE17136.1 proline dehydrogenase [Actinoplanes humidus]